MSPLERRGRLLLRAYPATYRQEHGAEILATLLEAAPAGQTRPSLREARALLAGGLRVRIASHRQLPTLASLRLAVLLGLAIAVVQAALLRVIWAVSEARLPLTGLRSGYGPGYLLPLAALTMTAATLLWFAPRRVTVPLLSFVAVATLLPSRAAGLGAAVPVVALAVLTAAGEAPRLPRSWLVWLGLPPAVLVADVVLPHWGAVAVVAAWLMPLYLLAGLLWFVVDSRVTAAVALQQGLLWIHTDVAPPVRVNGPVLIIAVVVIGIATLRMRPRRPQRV